MSDGSRLTRRQALRAGGLLAAAGLFTSPRLLAAACDLSPGVLEGDASTRAWKGPFWREGAPFAHSLRGSREDGDLLLISGRLLEAGTCRPIPGAVLDVWHCSPDGKYFTDPAAPVEAGIFRGRIRADGEGHYEYETLRPCNYKVDGALRPAHIHVQVPAGDGRPYITQMYFEGDPYLDKDPLDLVREPLISRPVRHHAGSTWRGRTATREFHTVDFDLTVPSRG